MESASFEPGDRVVVPWGLDKLDGVVERVVERGGRTSVDVVVSLPGEDEPESVNFPLSIVSSVESEDDGRLRGAGVWLEALHYEEALAETIRRMIAELSGQVETEDRRAPDHRADLEIKLADGRTLLVEAKRVEQVTSTTVNSAVNQIRRFIEASTEPARAIGLVVFGVSNGSSVDHWPATPDPRTPTVNVTTWRGHEDDDGLRATLSEIAA